MKNKTQKEQQNKKQKEQQKGPEPFTIRQCPACGLIHEYMDSSRYELNTKCDRCGHVLFYTEEMEEYEFNFRLIHEYLSYLGYLDQGFGDVVGRLHHAAEWHSRNYLPAIPEGRAGEQLKRRR